MLLAVDTSTRTMGIALYDGIRVLGEMIWSGGDYHTVQLAPSISDLMKRSGINPSQLDVLAVATGPGSFTGLRIGMALVKGMALARRLPLVGVPTLDFLAYSQPLHKERELVAVLRAGRGRLACGRYSPGVKKWESRGEAVVYTISELAESIQRPVLICGELSGEERRILGRKRKLAALSSPAQSLRRPSYLAELAWHRWQSGEEDDPALLAPVYLHYQETLPG
jgi:tRNA threonylcarbamoyladenosine biosynthesis protein TsaB